MICTILDKKQKNLYTFLHFKIAIFLFLNLVSICFSLLYIIFNALFFIIKQTFNLQNNNNDNKLFSTLFSAETRQMLLNLWNFKTKNKIHIIRYLNHPKNVYFFQIRSSLHFVCSLSIFIHLS